MRTFPISAESVIGKSISCVAENTLPIVECFYGIEGEGSDIGDMRVLLRVGGCMIKCTGCDSVHTWNANHAKLMTPIEIIELLEKETKGFRVKTVAVTGGEPMHYPKQMGYLADFLRDSGCRSWLETSGWILDTTVFRKFDFISFDVKTPSSGEACMTKQQVLELGEVAQELSSEGKGLHVKFIVKDKSDTDWIKELDVPNIFPHVNVKGTGLYRNLIITPACGKRFTPELIRERMELCMEELAGLPFRIIAQQHPLLNMK